MCGIAGFLGGHWHEGDAEMHAQISRMTDAIAHRGPDDDGVWLCRSSRLALGHRRLSVLDLSSAGHQPMQSPSGRFMLVFNGEIYNHLDLRGQLDLAGQETNGWKGHSDTETLLACFDAWGIEESLKRSIGMFAVAAWDQSNKQLVLARDRMGEKPLYFGWCGGAFVFASELKAIRKFNGFANEISRDALSLYFRYSYVPAPLSICKDIYKLEPGCTITVTLGAKKPSSTPRASNSGEGWKIEQYWSLYDKVVGQSVLIAQEPPGLIELESALMQATRLQSIADVPLGAFLSGGVDSSLIVALMQSQATRPVKTFTIGFHEDGYDEAGYAKAVAQHLHTDHTELYLSHDQAMEVIPRLPELYDEPFADSSQIPTYLVARMAREHVTVALSGDAGDELFGGYNRYFWGPKVWRKMSFLPGNMRNKLSGLLVSSSRTAAGGQVAVNRLLPTPLKDSLLGEKLQKLGQRLENVNNIDEFYHSLVSEWRNPEELVLGGEEAAFALKHRFECAKMRNPEDRMMYMDAMTYLPDDILCKVDRAAMAVSLETRVPFLDHRVVELAWRLPLNMKIRQGQGKWATRQILNKYVPRELVERPKKGFAIPLGQWLRGPLRDWAENLLNPGRLANEGYLRGEPVQQKWQEHLSGKRNWEHSLWSVLMFQAWLEKQREAG